MDPSLFLRPAFTFCSQSLASALPYTFIPPLLSPAVRSPLSYRQSQLQGHHLHHATNEVASLPLLTPVGPYWGLCQDTGPFLPTQ